MLNLLLTQASAPGLVTHHLWFVLCGAEACLPFSGCCSPKGDLPCLKALMPLFSGGSKDKSNERALGMLQEPDAQSGLWTRGRKFLDALSALSGICSAQEAAMLDLNHEGKTSFHKEEQRDLFISQRTSEFSLFLVFHVLGHVPIRLLCKED